jgi:hypothetical protein
MSDFTPYLKPTATPAIQDAADRHAADQVAPVAAALSTAQQTNTALATQLATQKAAFDAYRIAHPATAPVKVFRDFADQANAGLFVDSGTLVEDSIFQMTPMTSSKATAVAALTSADTNPYRLMRAGGSGTANLLTGVDLGGFDLVATPQGHIYHGLLVCYAISPIVHDIGVFGVPGLSSGPPTETMSLELLHTQDATIVNSILDGRLAGTAVAASLLAFNFTTGLTTVSKLSATYVKWGFAAAIWRCVGKHVFNDCNLGTANRKAINIEESDGGSYEFNRVDFRGLANSYVAQVSSRPGSAFSVPLVFRDCLVDGGILKVRTYPGYSAGQKDSDIKCFIGGKDVTADPTKFQILHAG